MELYEKQIQAIVKSLKTEMSIWFGTLAILAVMSFYFAHDMKKLEPSLTISLQSVLLLLLMVGLPGVFIWFRNKMAALLLVSDIEKRLNKYETYSRIRQALFFVFGLLILFMNVFTVLKGAPMLLLAVLVLGMFILPSRGRLVMETGLAKPEEVAEKDEEDMGSE
jgi:uncharacterized membrane protein